MIGVGDWKASEKIVDSVVEVLRSGRISYGPMSKKFETVWATMHLNDYGVLANSGTSALLVALEAMKIVNDWDDNAEVLVPASTFVATVNIVYQAGLKPVLVDVDPVHYLIDTNDAAAKLTTETRAIIPVHLFGQPADVRSFAYDNNLKVLEDSCECCGMSSIATGDITCFSFYVAHVLSTGVGGMAITDNEDYATTMRSLVNHGRDNIYICMDDSKDRLVEVIGRRFSFPRMGHSFRVTEIESAMALAQMSSLSYWLITRRTNALFLRQTLENLGVQDRIQLPYELMPKQHAWMMFPMVCDTPEHKESLCQFLEAAGIETRDALPLVTQPVYGIENPKKLYPNAYRLATCGFYVGCHPGLNIDNMLAIANNIKVWYNATYS